MKQMYLCLTVFTERYINHFDCYTCLGFIVSRSNDISVESCIELYVVFGTVRVQISVRRPTLLIEVFRHFTRIQSSQLNAGKMT